MTCTDLSERFGVLQLIDTLEVGGAERVALNLANHLPRERFISYLGTTRRDGPLADEVRPDVGRLRLGRCSRWDVSAARRLASFLRSHEVRVVHAHSTTLFLATAACLWARRTPLVWHDHYGADPERNARLYRPFVRRAAAVIAVNERLAGWSRQQLGVPADRIHYVPNFVAPIPGKAGRVEQLPGQPGERIVCVANLRPQKDHPNLLRAFAEVVANRPAAHLLVVGDGDPSYRGALLRQVESLKLGRSVTFPGEREDVRDILQGCDVGVLASRSEGLPLALLEYGAAGLPVVATRVGQCPEVLDDGRAGLLVEPGDPHALAGALSALLDDPKLRTELGGRLRDRVAERYDVATALGMVTAVYDQVLTNRFRTKSRSLPGNQPE